MKIYIGILLCLLLIFFGCTGTQETGQTNETNSTTEIIILENIPEDTPEVEEVDLSIAVLTDKDLYHSAETMQITTLINSNKDLESVSLSLNGVGGRYKEDLATNLIIGENTINTSFKLPKCNVCGGIREGMYDITATIELNNSIFLNSINIEIKQ